jgi:hypothetical protein
VKSSASSHLQRYASELKDVFNADDEFLFCGACGKSLVARQRSQVTQHLSGSKHIATVVRLEDRPGRQSPVDES